MPVTLANMYESLSTALQQEVFAYVQKLYEQNVLKGKKSARGIAAKYANPSLIEKEKSAMQNAFSGENV